VTLTDLKILSSLALYHSHRIPAAVNYRLFERSHDVAALDNAIAYERKAVEAWRQLVKAAGDVYTDDLMMGVRVADLCGHWKDELALLEKGLDNLSQKRRDFNSQENGQVKKAPAYRPAALASNDKLFRIAHKPVASAPAGKPLTISVQVSAPAGVKWVRLLYRGVNQDLAYQTLPMEPAAEKGTFQATVAADQINPKWDLMYLIEVMDNNGKGSIYPDLNKQTPYQIVKLIR
jgi:hypothetical protein